VAKCFATVLARLASTWLNELGWHPDLIELQLAHAECNEVRAAYNCAQRLPEQLTMMQAWNDYLDRLRDGTRSDLASVTTSLISPICNLIRERLKAARELHEENNGENAK
jgi:hypothetical protein